MVAGCYLTTVFINCVSGGFHMVAGCYLTIY